MNAILAVHPRPGKLWAFLQFPLVRFILGAAAVLLWVTVAGLAAKILGIPSHTFLGAVITLLMAAGVIAVYVCYVRVLEQRPAAELAPQAAAKLTARGILTGSGLFCITLLALKLAGAWTYTGVAPLAMLIYPFVGSVLAAVLEETLVRGLLFRILEESAGSWIALAVSAIVFGLLHAANPGANALSTVAIVLEAGVLLAAAYMYARSLWLSIGLHFGWNFTEGGVFAASVSGGRPEGVIGVQFSGPDLLTGGAFGPEASLPAILVCLAAGVFFIVLARRNGRMVAPRWKRR